MNMQAIIYFVNSHTNLKQRKSHPPTRAKSNFDVRVARARVAESRVDFTVRSGAIVAKLIFHVGNITFGLFNLDFMFNKYVFQA